MSNTTFNTGKYYKLTSKHGEETIAYFYKNPDAGGTGLGFGFNIADGGGFLPEYDLTESTVIEELKWVI